MCRKLLAVTLTVTIFSFMGVFGTGCATKIQTPEVEETEETTQEVIQPAPEPTPDPNLVSEEGTYEGFKPVEEPPPPPKREMADVRFDDIHFDFDKYDIKWDDKARLQDIAQTMKNDPRLFLTIEGHCDSRGTNTYNRALGEKRAIAVQDFLYSLGIMKNKTQTVSYGEESPLCWDENENCWQRNRRAHFLVSVGGN